MSYQQPVRAALPDRPTIWDIVRFLLILLILVVLGLVVLIALADTIFGDQAPDALELPRTPQEAWVWLASFAIFYLACIGAIRLAMLPHGAAWSRALALVPTRWGIVIAGAVAIVVLSIGLELAAARALRDLFGGSVEAEMVVLIRSLTQTPVLMATAIAILALLAPLVEEFIFRGLLFGWIRAHLPFWPTALITAALFGLAHGDPGHAIMAGAIGLGLAYLRERSGSLWAPIAAHMLNNLVAVASASFGG